MSYPTIAQYRTGIERALELLGDESYAGDWIDAVYATGVTAGDEIRRSIRFECEGDEPYPNSTDTVERILRELLDEQTRLDVARRKVSS